MGLKNTLSNGVKKAFLAMGDLVKNVVFVENTVGTYNPTTDATNDVGVNHTLDVILVKPTEQELSFSPGLDLLTKKMLIAGKDVSFVPNTTDYVLIDTVKHEIRKVTRVPGDSVFICFIQET